MKKIYTLLGIWLLFHSAQATSIVPYINLAELAMESDVVLLATCHGEESTEMDGIIRSQFIFTAHDIISGSIENDFTIRNFHLQFEELEREVFGDVTFSAESNYLLFLRRMPDGTYTTMMLSYAVFYEKTIDNIPLLIPMEESDQLHMVERPDGRSVEPLQVLKKSALITELKEVLHHSKKWNIEHAKTDLRIKEKVATLRAAPSHCTFFNGKPRWRDFPDVLPVRYHSGGDAGCSNIQSKVNSAITEMNNQYQGINLSAAGTHNYNPSASVCSSQGSTGSNFTQWVNNNLGGTRHMIIQFDDPCNEIANLSSCGGTLAFGGLYRNGQTYSAGGDTWQTAMYGYVVMNNGVGNCYCNSIYTEILIHEMTHALGIGHIASSEGQANMNPSGPGDITNLDKECLDYAYNPTGGGGNCDNTESVVNTTINTDTEIRAQSSISLDDVVVTGNAKLTLIAPSINIAPTVNVQNNGELVTINEDGCN